MHVTEGRGSWWQVAHSARMPTVEGAVEVDLEADDTLRSIFEAVCTADDHGGNTRKFSRTDVENFLKDLKNDPGIAEVHAYNDFRYSVDNTVEREYWLVLNSRLHPELGGKDGYGILHVHYGGQWAACPSDRDRSVIKQVNIRHTWDSSRGDFEKFWKKCTDLNKWRENRGAVVLGGREAPGGWK